MRFEDFRHKVRVYPYFRSNIFTHLTAKPDVLRRQVTEWTKKNLLIEIKRGMYTLNEIDRACPLSLHFLANQIYSPSYISLGSALSHYRMIPERIVSITSITSKKTQAFENQLGHFSYRHIKQVCFNHFTAHEDERGQQYLMAKPEKAMIDFLYLNTPHLKVFDEDFFELSLRLQNLDILNNEKLIFYAQEFKQKKLMKLTQLLIQYKEKNHD